MNRQVAIISLSIVILRPHLYSTTVSTPKVLFLYDFLEQMSRFNVPYFDKLFPYFPSWCGALFFILRSRQAFFSKSTRTAERFYQGNLNFVSRDLNLIFLRTFRTSICSDHIRHSYPLFSSAEVCTKDSAACCQK